MDEPGIGPEKGICINPKCRRTFVIPAGHQGRKPVLCPGCKEAGVKIKDLPGVKDWSGGKPTKGKAEKKPPAKKDQLPKPFENQDSKAQHGPFPLQAVPEPEKTATVTKLPGNQLVRKLREFESDEEAEAYLEGYGDGIAARG